MSQRRPKLVVVDDGDRYIELAHALLRDYDYATRCDEIGPCWECPRAVGCTLTHAHDAREMDEILARHPDADVVLLDVAFDIPDARLLPSDESDQIRRRRLQGIEILRYLRRGRGELPVILMTSHEELLLEDGPKDWEADELLALAGSDALDARAIGLLIERILARRAEVRERGGYVYGRSPAMAKLRRSALTLSRTSLPMLLLGETGTGKSALAEHVLHPESGRQGGFVAADLSAVPPQLLAAELFGTARGAFSGAVDREGLIERADRGTLLLDEIGNLPLDVQRMLLLTLQSGRVTRLGEARPRPVDIKLIAATNVDLAAEVGAGRFRADLYARLNPAASLCLPPLRERRGDLELLIGVFVARAFASGGDRGLLADYMDCAGLGGIPSAHVVFGSPPSARRGDDPGIDAAAGSTLEAGVGFVFSSLTMAALREHGWPGNLRELELVVRSATSLALADALRAAEEGRGATGTMGRTIPLPPKLIRELIAASFFDVSPAGGPAPRLPGRAATSSPANRPGSSLVTPGPTDPSTSSAPSVPQPRPQPSLRDVSRALERELYRRLFEETGGDFVHMAARLLEGDANLNARRVRLRFNQLGLRATELRRQPRDRG